MYLKQTSTHTITCPIIILSLKTNRSYYISTFGMLLDVCVFRLLIHLTTSGGGIVREAVYWEFKHYSWKRGINT